MTDLSSTIIAKSDQLNADDLLSGPITVTITKVSADESSEQQPILISYAGDNKKPYKPCKSMRRVLVNVWGKNGAGYVGRSMTLYREPTVTWGKLEVGGIRISHMSGIDDAMVMPLTASKQNKRAYTVKPLRVTPDDDAVVDKATLVAVRAAAAKGTDAFNEWWKSASKKERADAATIKDELITSRVVADSKLKKGNTEQPDRQASGGDEEGDVPASPSSSQVNQERGPTPDEIAKAESDGQTHAEDGRSIRAMPAEYRDIPELRSAYTGGFNAVSRNGEA